MISVKRCIDSGINPSRQGYFLYDQSISARNSELLLIRNTPIVKDAEVKWKARPPNFTVYKIRGTRFEKYLMNVIGMSQSSDAS